MANLRVARIILTPRLPISPILVHYRASQKTDLGRAIYANSITLTPGTITTGVVGDDLEVHSLTWVDVDGREEDEMDRRVRGWSRANGGLRPLRRRRSRNDVRGRGRRHPRRHGHGHGSGPSSAPRSTTASWQ